MFTHVLDLNKTSASKTLMQHLTLPLPMDTNSCDERNFLSGAAKMPVPYHLDESDSDSIVSRKFSSEFYFLCMLVYLSRERAEQVYGSADLVNILALILDSERKFNGICGSYDHSGSRFYPVFWPGFWILAVR